MTFDFTNYTFSGLLSILASLYGVGYPLIIQSIERIYSQYDSALLANRFTKEPVYKLFQASLVINLIFAIATPFLFLAEWWNIGFVTIQACLLVVLISSAFMLFQLMIKYGNAKELLRHVEGRQIVNSNVMDILDIAIYADSKNNHQLYIDAMSSVFAYIQKQQFDYDGSSPDIDFQTPVVYDSQVVEIIKKIKGYIREDDGHHQLHRNNDIVSVLYNQLSKTRISSQTHTLMWGLLNESITFDNHSWFKQYWQFADSYASLKYRFPASETERKDKYEFMMRHVMVGTLLLHHNRYQWLNDVILYTHSEPEFFGLIPSSFAEILYMIQRIDHICSIPESSYYNFYFSNEMGGVKDGQFIFREAVRYLSLTVIRLWSLQPQEYFGGHNAFAMPLTPTLISDLERCVSIMDMMVSDVKSYYDSSIFEKIPRLKKVELASILKLLKEYQDTCAETRIERLEHPDVDPRKFEKMLAEAKEFSETFNLSLPDSKQPSADWGGDCVISKVVCCQDELETINYSRYRDFGILKHVVYTNFMFELHRFYLESLERMKRLATYDVPRDQLKTFLDAIGYNNEDYAIIVSEEDAGVDSPNVTLNAKIRPYTIFILKKTDVPYATLALCEEGKLERLGDNCLISSNLAHFIECHNPRFILSVATNMEVYSNPKTKGVVLIRVNDDYIVQGLNVSVDKTLAELYE